MLTRIVKMTFKPELVDDFLAIFEEVKDRIAAFDGCQKVDLFHDVKTPNVIFTISLWESESHLNAYRHSTLFEGTWKRTKLLFDDKPVAWSLSQFDLQKN